VEDDGPEVEVGASPFQMSCCANMNCRVKDHAALKNGNRTRFNCCQDKQHKTAKKATDPSKKPRDNLGIPRFDCQSYLRVRVAHEDSRIQITLEVEHRMKHPAYFDIHIPPKAMDIILRNGQRHQ